MRRLISIFSSAFFVLFPLCLFAQEKEVTLEKVVVTATRDAEEVRKIPANVTVITKEQIEEAHVETVVDLMRDQVGIVVKDVYGNGKSTTVDVRGFGETAPPNTLVLVDGRRVNEIDLSGVDWTQIALNQIERIEIVRGSGSVLYGDNAVGGVINIITKKPEKTFSFQTGVALGSYNYNKEYGSVSGKWGPLSAILNMTYNATEGYRDDGLLRAKNVGGKIIYDLNDNVSFNLSGAFNRDKQGLPGGLTQTEIDLLGRRATLTPNNQAKTDDGYGDLGAKVKLWDFGRIEADLSYRERRVDNFLDFPSSFYTYTDERKLSTWGLTPRYLLDKPIWKFSNKFTLGLDLYRSESEVDSESVFFGFPSSNRSDITKKTIGPYFFDEFSILENLILSLGYRYEWATYDISQENPLLKDKAKYGEPAWNVGLNYLFGKGSSAFISAKKSFRFPTTDELVLVFPVARVNPTMKPQTGYDYEAGIRYAFTDKIGANLTFFWMDTTDEIFFNPVTFVNENYPKTRRLGLEIAGKATLFPWLSVWANYAYIQPTLQADLIIGNQIFQFSGNDIPGVPRNKGSIGADVKILDVKILKGFLFSAKATLVGSSYFISDFANSFGKQGKYYTLDARLSYNWKGLNAFFGVNNITNQKYSELAVTNATGTRQLFYPSPERNFLGGISYSF
jgi:iron complex outermembrane receptor protein